MIKRIQFGQNYNTRPRIDSTAFKGVNIKPSIDDDILEGIQELKGFIQDTPDAFYKTCKKNNNSISTKRDEWHGFLNAELSPDNGIMNFYKSIYDCRGKNITSHDIKVALVPTQVEKQMVQAGDIISVDGKIGKYSLSDKELALELGQKIEQAIKGDLDAFKRLREGESPAKIGIFD